MQARIFHAITVLAVAAGAATLAGDPARAAGAVSAPLTDWPHIDSAVHRDAALEARVDAILAGMSLAEKVGQMTQAEIKSITPEQVREYHIGSVLNGGGSWPGQDKHATVADWVRLADAYYRASMAADARTPIPLIWGTDAVHGHSNVVGATLFPHNIGLGAAHDAALVERIGRATAQSTRATGIQWVFAPTLAVAQNPRWGRTYESFSSDPGVVRDYAAAYIRGLQGDLHGDGDVVATAKHFIGDGATFQGKDQGNAQVSRDTMINVHGQGYYGALASGVQTVMASFNSWNDVAARHDYGKMHGAQALLTGALKEKMGFDGFIVSDWNAIAQVPGCSNASCPQAINAGIDMVMVPDDWKAFIANTMQQVEAGAIPMSRIDDAVRRIVRVKLRAGLFEHAPGEGRFAGDADALVHRALAREAVRKSLVLLKNQGGALPLRVGQRVLVVGKSADSKANQSGGWSLTWQGTDNAADDYLHADSVLAGLRAALGADRVQYSETGNGVDPAQIDAVVAVIGETPYAETNGDIVASDTVAHSRRHPEDLAVLRAAAALGKPVITVFLSGRPLYANDLINRSDAFVAAWLPGSEGGGIADVLVGSARGKPRFDFQGRLPFSWPAVACPAAEDAVDTAAPALFARGYGLTYARPGTVPALPEAAPAACGAAAALPVFNTGDAGSFRLQVATDSAAQALGDSLNGSLQWPDPHPVVRVRTVQINTQQDAKQVTWLAPARLLSRSASATDLTALEQADGALQFDLKLTHAPAAAVLASMECGPQCGGSVDLAPVLRGHAPGETITVNVPLRCFARRGVDLGGVYVPFSISAQAPFAAAFARVAIVAGAAKAPGALDCATGP